MCCESVIDRWLRKINSHCYNIYKIIIIIRLLLHLALFKDTSIAFTNIVTGHGIRLWFVQKQCCSSVIEIGNGTQSEAHHALYILCTLYMDTVMLSLLI